MKRKITFISAVVLLAAVFSFHACKNEEIVMFNVTVLVSDGVSGIPGTGTYTLARGEELQYSYTLNEGHSKLKVLFDGTEIAASGKLTVTSDFTLQAFADDQFQRALTVTLTEGVVGTPAAGTYNYPEGTLVNYSYALEDGYFSLAVFLDDELAPSSGTISLAESHTLNVTALAGKKVPGTWLLTETYQDEATFNVTATFIGTFAAGTVTDSDGGSGTYTFSGSTVKFNLVFPQVTYEYEGTFDDSDTMSGTCKRYPTAETVVSGVWKATRKIGSTTATSRQTAVVRGGGKGDAGRSGRR